MKKISVDYNEVYQLSVDLAERIKESGFKPDLICAIGTGGLVPGVVIGKQLESPLYAVVVKRYPDSGQSPILKDPSILQWVAPEVVQKKNVLVVDEVCDEGRTLDFVISRLKMFSPKALAAAVLHRKKRKVNRALSGKFALFVGKETPNVWIVYPWEKS